MSSKSKASSPKPKRRRHPEVEIASIAVRSGYISSETAKGVLREVKERSKQGKGRRTSLIRVLRRQQLLSRKQCEDLAYEIERHTYICDSCDHRCVLAPSSRQMLTCPRCSQPIEALYTETSRQTRFVETARVPEPSGEAGGIDALINSDRPVFGRYKIRKELGRGAMGAVYQARHLELKKDVALKVLLAGLGVKPSHIDRFRREAAAVQRLKHPNIVRVFDFGSDEAMYFLAMELVEGGYSLHTALKEKETLNLKARLEILTKVCFAMQHAHEQGIVHRDLKPANILLAPEGEPLVADFGLAKDFEDDDDELTKPDARLGTPLFLAPECIHKGAAALDERADVWSLGVMLFLSVTGRYPFRAKTVMELYVQVLQKKPDWSGARASKLVSSQSEQITKRLQQPFANVSTNFQEN